MRSRMAVFALALMVLGVAAPGIEAVAGCLELCPDEGSGRDECTRDACCSCCLHAGPLFTSRPMPEPGLLPAGVASSPCALPLLEAGSADILHVPKGLAD